MIVFFTPFLPELARLKKDNNSLTLLTCTPCRTRLEKAVQDAGHKDMTTFLVTDARMHITLKAYVTVAITKLAGEVGQKVAAEDFCNSKENVARSQDPKEMQYQCEQFVGYTSYLDQAGSIVVNLAGKLLNDGDIVAVAKHIKAINAALSNPKLPGEFRHSSGGGFDD
jgi:hypothetical protein